MPARKHPKTSKRLVLGTRGSPLAIWQTNEVVKKIHAKFPSIKIETKIIKTTGDKFSGKLPSVKGYAGKGLFVKEIEESLVLGKIDIAVHSLKDVPAYLPKELQLTAFLKRENPHDLFISKKYKNIISLPRGKTLGTSSPRRGALALMQNPKLKIVPLRGNVETRIRKLEEGVCDATILAAAGIKRLKLFSRLKHCNTETLKRFVPAIGQGIVCVESRKNDFKINKILRDTLNHSRTEKAAIAEREFLRTIGGDCHTPIAGHAKINGRKIVLEGFVGSPDEKGHIRKKTIGDDPLTVGHKLGADFVRLGARKIICLNRPLAGKEVLLTQLDGFNLARRLKSEGAKVIRLPLIKIKDPADKFKSMDQAFEYLDKYSWVLFTSQNGVKKFFGRLKSKKIKIKLPKIAVVGPGTAKAVRMFGYKPILMPKKEFSSFGLLSEFKRIDVKKVRILFPRAKEGLDVLVNGLRKRGAVIDVVEAYETVPVKINSRKIDPDVIFFSSPSAVKSFVKNFGVELLKKSEISCVGKTTENALLRFFGEFRRFVWLNS